MRSSPEAAEYLPTAPGARAIAYTRPRPTMSSRYSS